MSDDLEFIVIDDIPEYIFCIGDDEENEQVIAISGKDGAFKYEKVTELPTTGEDGVLYLVPKSHTTQTASGNPISVNITDNAGKIESLKLDGGTTQQTYSGAQMLKKQGMATPSSDTNYWISFTNLTQTPGSNGWAKFEKTATNEYANFNTSISSVDITGGQTYTAIVEVKNSTFTDGHMVFTQPGQTQDPVSSYTIVQGCDFTNANSMGAYLSSAPSPNVYTFVAKSSFTRGLRYYIQTATTGSVEVRATVLAGDHSSDWQDYCGDNWQPYVGETASPSPTFPQPVQAVTGTQTITINGTNYPLDLGTIELCKIGTYQDYIYKSGSDWKVHKATAELDFSSITSGTGGSTISEKTVRVEYTGTVPAGAADGDDRRLALSSHFTNELNYSDDIVGFYYNKTQLNIWFRVPKTIATTWQDAASWITAHGVTAYLPLSTPTDTVITDTALIAQLEAVRTAALSTGSNTISNTATGTNLAGDLEIGYYGYDPLNKYDKYFWLDIDGGYESL